MRRLRPRGLPYVALGCAILATQTLKADTILINDLPGLITVSVTDPVREQASSGTRVADVVIYPPVYGATLIAFAGLYEWQFVEPGTDCYFCFPVASDFAYAYEADLPSGAGATVIFHFFSMDEVITFSSSPFIVENGDVQTILGLEWSDGTIDTIEFKSTEPTAEPSTLLLLCTGILGVFGATGRRKYFSCVFFNARTRRVFAAQRLRS